jgi:outer membrane protein TolC
VPGKFFVRRLFAETLYLSNLFQSDFFNFQLAINLYFTLICQTYDSNDRSIKDFNMRLCLWLSFALLSFNPLYAQQTFSLSEKALAGLSLEASPQWEAIEAAFLTTKLESEKLHDRFRPEIFGSGQYAETRERAIIQFIPVWSPTKTAQIGVRQAFRGGVSLSASLGADQRSAMTPSGAFRDVSTSEVRLDLQVDLWKDLLGRLSKAQSDSATFDKERAELDREINRKAFLISLRRTYWSLVANSEQIKIYEGLKSISEKQLKDARARLRAGVTDGGEVARYEAQVASREGSSLYYRYQREIYLKQLKTLVPELQTKQILLADYNVPDMIKNVLACTQVIAGQKDVPLEFTRYDEVTKLLRQSQKEQNKLASSYDEVDLKFVGSVKTTGVASNNNGNGTTRGSYGSAFDDWQDNNRTGYSAGLEVVIPLGKEDTRQTQELLAQKRFDSQINQNDANLINTHQQLVKVIALLTDVVRAQKQNTEALERRLVVQDRKFREARLSVNDLILDQDALLNSSLITVNTQLEIINTILDYLVVFTETPCEFNRI